MSWVKRSTQVFVRYFERQNSFLTTFCGILIAILMVFTVYEVVMRYCFDNPTNWVAEISSYVLVAIILLPLAYAQQIGRHAKVDVLVLRLSKRKQAILGIVSSLLGLCFFILFTWAGYRYAIDALQTGEISTTTMGAPLFPVKIILPIGGFLLCIQFIISIGKHIIFLRSREQEDD